MRRSKHTLVSRGLVVVGICLIFGLTALAKAPNAGSGRIKNDRDSGPLRLPAPITVDQVIHNVGNIATTVDNYGYIGGYREYGLPSGEWPRGSGHNYIGEIKYWIGGVKPNGDTVVANTEDDFQAVPSLISGVDEYKILLSTDTARYFGYNQADTVGLGHGNPARGWRVYNLDSSAWTYANNYSPIDSAFYSGGPVSLQESHFVFNDDASGNAPMGVELTHTMMQWNYCYNEDITFVVLQIKNTSATDYTNVAVGLYIDIDVGGPDGHGENGRLGDLVARDSSMNLAWIYDADGNDPGWGPLVKTGIMGTRLLETPDNVGMTAFRSGDWGAVTNIDDIGRYDLISSHQYDESLPPTDQYYIQCAGGINLNAGKTVKVVYALIAGKNVQDFKAKAELALTLYNNHFVGPQPPATPILSARSADRKVYLHWTDTSEVTPDPLSGQIDFAGYKLYRSDNQGKTWGVIDDKTDNKCMTVDYSPIGLYTRTAPGDPIQHSFVDTGLFNGVDYWYCLAAFDRGDTVTGVDVLQSGFGEPGSSANVVVSRPHNDPAGGYDAASTVTHQYTGSETPSAGTVTPLEFEKDSLQGADYAVGFKDTPEKTYWYVLNVTTGDTILNNQVLENADPGLYSVRQGIRVVVNNVDRWPASYGQVLNPGGDTTIALKYFWGPSLPALFGDSLYGDAKYRSTYEIRWTADSTLAPNVYGSTYQLYSVPVEVWNTTTGQRVSLAVLDATESGTWYPYRSLIIIDQPYNPAEDLFATAYPYGFGWIFKFDTAQYAPALGDRFRFTGAPVNGPNDRFAFRVDGINAATASIDLSKIRVVPNPYLVQYSASVETGQGQSVLEFQKIPDKCTIRIYTLAGDLVATIEHTDGTGTARWDLKSRSAEQVASGIYLFHVESPYGQHLGRFAIIK